MRIAICAAAWMGVAVAAFASPFQYGDIFVSAANGNVYRYNQSGTLLQVMNAGSTAYGLAFDNTGNLYVATGSAIQKFDNTGASKGAFTTSFPGTLHSATDIDFDASGNAFVVGIQDLNYDFIRKYSSAGTILGTQSILQGQENWVYANYAGGNTLLVTPGTTTLIVPVDTNTLTPGAPVYVLNAGPNGDVQGLSGGGFLLATGDPIDQVSPSGTVELMYNSMISGTWIGVDSQTPSTFWAVTDFGEVREFNLGVATPAAGFSTGVNGRAIAVFTGAAVTSSAPEPSTFALVLGGAGLMAALRRRRRAAGGSA